MFCTNHSESSRLALWFLIFAYVAALPYAVLLVNLALDYSSVEFLRLFIGGAVSFTLILLGCIVLRRKGWFSFLRSIWFPAGLCLSVVALESNVIKYIHIPEYLVLTSLIYTALHGGTFKAGVLVASFCCSVLFGVFDEIHQGIHPSRYFGWKDMWINSSGSALFCWWIWMLNTSNKSFSSTALFKLRFHLEVPAISVLLQCCVLAMLLVFLFEGSRSGGVLALPKVLFVVSLLVGLSSLIATFWTQRNTPMIERSLYFWPSIILLLNILVSLLADSLDVHFL